VRAKILDTFGFLRFVLRRWSEDRCPQIAGSLTYTTLLSLAPVFAIAVALLSSAPFFEDVMAQIKIFLLLNLTPDIAHTIITVYMAEFTRNARRLTWVGTAAVLVVAVWLMLIMDRSLNAIWRVREKRPLWISLAGYVALVVTGPVLIGVSVTVTTYIMSVSAGLGDVSANLHALALRLVPVLMSALAFYLIYRIIPHRRVAWRHALLGALVAAVLFESSKQLFAFYAHVSPTYHVVYGAFAAVPLFLIWIYLSWLVVLFGAELTASAPYWRKALWKTASNPATRFREALTVTQALLQSGGEALTFNLLRSRTGLPAQELEETLAQMEEAGIVRVPARGAYALTRETYDVLAGSRMPAVATVPAGGINAEARRGGAEDTQGKI
jgi:membrane protein